MESFVTVEYKIVRFNFQYFTATMSIRIWHNYQAKVLSTVQTAGTRKKAKLAASLDIIGQLYRLGLVEAYPVSPTQSAAVDNTAANTSTNTDEVISLVFISYRLGNSDNYNSPSPPGFFCLVDLSCIICILRSYTISWCKTTPYTLSPYLTI